VSPTFPIRRSVSQTVNLRQSTQRPTYVPVGPSVVLVCVAFRPVIRGHRRATKEDVVHCRPPARLTKIWHVRRYKSQIKLGRWPRRCDAMHSQSVCALRKHVVKQQILHSLQTWISHQRFLASRLHIYTLLLSQCLSIYVDTNMSKLVVLVLFSHYWLISDT